MSIHLTILLHGKLCVNLLPPVVLAYLDLQKPGFLRDPSGEFRIAKVSYREHNETWKPNLVTQEGIGGDETAPTNSQTSTILFTRMLAGAGDNTICY